MNVVTRTLAALALGIAAAGVAGAQELDQLNPIEDIALDMHVVVGKLEKKITQQPTQVVQAEVVSKLDKLIEELEKQCKACKGARSGRNPNRPALDSFIKAGPGGMGKLHAANQDGKKWGELPPHERDRILQSLTEGFPPHYHQILERYYKRLAEEKPASDAADAPAPKKSGERAKSAAVESKTSSGEATQ